MNDWLIVKREKASAEANMAMDAMLLRRLACVPQPVLHLYEWEAPSITYGYFIDPEKYLHLDVIKEMGIQLARRPTGGGIICHTTDFAFSLLMPANHHAYSTNTLENYAYINLLVMKTICPVIPKGHLMNFFTCKTDCVRFCMAEPTVYDVMIGERKVVGGAQRRTKHGYLHQGTVSLSIPESSFLKKILKDESIAHLMRQNTFPLSQKEDLEDMRSKLQMLFQKMGSDDD